MGVPSTDIFCSLLGLCLWKGKQNREGQKNRSLQHPFQMWHKLDCAVPNGTYETNEICIAEQHQTYSLHLSQAYCPGTGQMPSVLAVLLSRFLRDYLVPSFPSLGIFIWRWNFLSIPGKVRETPRRRNKSTSPSGRNWAIEGNFIVCVPAIWPFDMSISRIHCCSSTCLRDNFLGQTNVCSC